MRIANRTFIVSGGSSGLGHATVLELHAQGAYVAILDRADAPVNPSDERVRYFCVDITRTEDVRHAVEGIAAWARETQAHLGGVINVAGIGIAGKIINAAGEPFSLDLFNLTLAVNLSGTFDLTRQVCKHLIHVPPVGADGERGIVIMVSSAAAFEGQPGQAAYSASKGAINAMTLPLARDLGPRGIRVNTIAPGIFDTPLVAGLVAAENKRRSFNREQVFPRRFGHATEFAETVRWMIECGYINGETVRLSGAQRLASRL